MRTIKVGDRVFCWNFQQWGTVTEVSADSIGNIIGYIDDDGEKHKVYEYMISCQTI